MKARRLVLVLFLSVLAVFACVRERNSAFELRLVRGASCENVVISCAKVLNLTLDHPQPQSWRVAINGTSSGVHFGALSLPNAGTGQFFVVGSSLGLGPVFAGSSGLVTFDTGNGSADVLFECLLPPVCPLVTPPIPTPTPFVATADLVLGKDAFTLCDNGANGVNESFELEEPDGLERADGKIWVADARYHRAAVWSTAGLASGKQIDFVVQQNNRTDTANGGGSNDADLPRDVLIAPGLPLRLMVDTQNHRIGRNTTIPTVDSGSPNNDNYETVFGQNNPGSTNGANAGGRDADSLAAPWSAVIVGTNVWVSDTNNHRVLRYALADIATDRPVANLVLGQADFTTATAAAGAGMNTPRHLATDGTRLFVADMGNNRVLVFDGLDALANGAPASLVIGQNALDTSGAGAGMTGLNAPRGVAADAQRVVIADSGNHRVLVFTPPPIANGAAAAQVIGQPDFVSIEPNYDGAAGTCPDLATCNGLGELKEPTANAMLRPGAVFIEGRTLWVSDTCNSRLLRFREPGG